MTDNHAHALKRVIIGLIPPIGLLLLLAGLFTLSGGDVSPELMRTIQAFTMEEVYALSACLIVVGTGFIVIPRLSFKVLSSDYQGSAEYWFASDGRARVFIISLTAYGISALILAIYGYSSLLLPVFFASLIGVIASFHARREDTKSILPLDRIDLWLLGAIVACASFVLSRDLLFWDFGFVGDEFPFFEMARAVKNGTEERGLTILDYDGVFRKFPMGDSYYAALFLKIGGESLWAWKMSCVFIHVATAVLVYIFAKTLYGRTAAVVSANCLTFSHYFMAFDKIGYNNTNICFTSTLAFLLFVCAYRTHRRDLFFLTGLSAGFLTYSNWGGLITWPALGCAWLCLSLKQRRIRFATTTFATITLGFVLGLIPGILTNELDTIRAVALDLNHQRTFGTIAFGGLFDVFIKSISSFWGRSDRGGSHYVSLPLIDILTSALLIGGLALSLRKLRSEQSIIVLTWLLVGSVGVVFLSSSDEVSITRLLYLLPVISIIAGLTAQELLRGFTSPSYRVALAACVVMAIFGLNIHKLYFFSPDYLGYKEIRLALSEMRGTSATGIVYVFPGHVINQDTKEFLTSYTPPDKRLLVVTEEQLRNDMKSGTISNEIRQGKIIAPPGLKPLLDDMQTAGSIPGPVISVSGRCCGSIATANDPSSSLGVMRPKSFYQLVRFWLTEIFEGEVVALQGLREPKQ
jgi:hypothetical protein